MGFFELLNEYWFIIFLLMVWDLVAHNVAFIRNPVSYWQTKIFGIAAILWVFVFLDQDLYYLILLTFIWQMVLAAIKPQKFLLTYNSLIQFLTFQQPRYLAQQQADQGTENSLWVPADTTMNLDVPDSFHKPARITTTLIIEACILGLALLGYFSIYIRG